MLNVKTVCRQSIIVNLTTVGVVQPVSSFLSFESIKVDPAMELLKVPCFVTLSKSIGLFIGW